MSRSNAASGSVALSCAAELPPLSSRGGLSTAQGRPWIYFCGRLPLAWIHLRRHWPKIRALKRGPWALLRAIADHWRGKTEASPGQQWLAEFTGYDVRSLREYTKTLERLELVSLRREYRPDGSERIHYAPGPALLAAVEDFVGHYPDDHARRLRSETRPPSLQLDEEALRIHHELRAAQNALAQARARIAELEGERAQLTPSHPPEMVSAGPPEAISGELSDLQDQREPSSSCAKSLAPTDANEEEVSRVSEIDREVARSALTERRKRRFPDRVSALFDANDVAMAAACSSAIDGDREAKMRAQLDAMDNAFEVSKGQPTVRYIWGSLDHFLEHEARGRCRRLESERQHELRARRRRVARQEDPCEARKADAPPLSAAECARLHGARLVMIQQAHASGTCAWCGTPAETAGLVQESPPLASITQSRPKAENE